MALVCPRCRYRPTRGTLEECPKCGADLEETTAMRVAEKGKRDKRKLAAARSGAGEKRSSWPHES